MEDVIGVQTATCTERYEGPFFIVKQNGHVIMRIAQLWPTGSTITRYFAVLKPDNKPRSDI
jgi:hypothetical protein